MLLIVLLGQSNATHVVALERANQQFTRDDQFNKNGQWRLNTSTQRLCWMTAHTD